MAFSCSGKAQGKKIEVPPEGQSVSHVNTKAPPWQLLNESVEITLPAIVFSL